MTTNALGWTSASVASERSGRVTAMMAIACSHQEGRSGIDYLYRWSRNLPNPDREYVLSDVQYENMVVRIDSWVSQNDFAEIQWLVYQLKRRIRESEQSRTRGGNGNSAAAAHWESVMTRFIGVIFDSFPSYFE